MEHFYESLEFCDIDVSMFSWPILYKSAVEKCRDNGTIIEVGSWVGQSTAYLMVEAINSKKNINIISVDSFLGNRENANIILDNPQWETYRKNLVPIWKNLIVIKNLSHLAANYFKDEDIDFVFIDAGHSYEDIQQDIKCWWPKVIKGGVLAGHDFHYPPIRQAVQEFSELIKIQYLSNLQENCWMFIKEN